MQPIQLAFHSRSGLIKVHQSFFLRKMPLNRGVHPNDPFRNFPGCFHDRSFGNLMFIQAFNDFGGRLQLGMAFMFLTMI
jgi:hypothetical protein